MLPFLSFPSLPPLHGSAPSVTFRGDKGLVFFVLRTYLNTGCFCFWWSDLEFEDKDREFNWELIIDSWKFVESWESGRPWFHMSVKLKQRGSTSYLSKYLSRNSSTFSIKGCRLKLRLSRHSSNPFQFSKFLLSVVEFHTINFRGGYFRGGYFSYRKDTNFLKNNTFFHVYYRIIGRAEGWVFRV